MIKNVGNVLIAGSKGLIGSACFKKMQDYGYNNLFYPSKEELNYLEYEAFLNFSIKHKINTIIYAVGKVGGILDNNSNQSNYLLYNSELALNLFKVVQNSDVTESIVFGSSCMYPVNADQPYNEKSIFTGPIEKTSEGYAISKLLLARGSNLLNLSNNNKCCFKIMIPNSTYGPNDNFNIETAHVMSALIKKISDAKNQKIPKIKLLGSGLPLREFVYSDDVANAIIMLLNNELNQTEQIFNIGSSEEISIKQLSKKISKIIGFEGIIEFDKSKPDGALRKYLDSSKINRIGWKPKILLNEGIKKTYEWYLKNYDH